MELDIKEIDDLCVITPKEKRIDVTTSTSFKGAITDLINQGKKHLIFDLAEVDLIDSSGLGVLISIYRTLEEDGSMVLCKIQTPILSLFEVTRLLQVFTIVDNLEEAKNKIREKKTAG